MMDLPRLNRIVVNSAPGHTSRQATRASGRYLNKQANTSVEITTDKPADTAASSTMLSSGNARARLSENPAIKALITKLTTIRKPRPSTNENEIRRSQKNLAIEL